MKLSHKSVGALCLLYGNQSRWFCFILEVPQKIKKGRIIIELLTVAL